jgi:hypothetical protein
LLGKLFLIFKGNQTVFLGFEGVELIEEVSGLRFVYKVEYEFLVELIVVFMYALFIFILGEFITVCHVVRRLHVEYELRSNTFAIGYFGCQ